jgi:hypothetical protein
MAGSEDFAGNGTLLADGGMRLRRNEQEIEKIERKKNNNINEWV